jgi:hypothetical protein
MPRQSTLELLVSFGQQVFRLGLLFHALLVDLVGQLEVFGLFGDKGPRL